MGKHSGTGLRLGLAQPDDGGALSQARITAVSNSAPQRLFIEEARARGLTNLRVITCDMNDFQPDTRFDRIVSVEMFEHMANWQDLLDAPAAGCCPRAACSCMSSAIAASPIASTRADKTDWIAQHFFTGGIMPSHGLIDHFPRASPSSKAGDGRAALPAHRRPVAEEFRRQPRGYR
jgi:cyclopropane fatty-acyl-phospholipid synthase-like methyltransferase